MRKSKPPIIDKDLENRAFRVFLRLIGTDYCKGKTTYGVASGAIVFARQFDHAWRDSFLPDALNPSDEVLEEYHSGNFDDTDY